jgi:lipoyl-dependent peroxiredoxin
MADRKATTIWQGDLPSGKGETSFDSSHIAGPVPVSWAARTESPNGMTSPEELIAAAHSACYSMALSGILGRGGHPPDRLETSAVASFERQGEGFAITRVALTLRAAIPGISEEDFQKAAQDAKAGCPVSKALAGNVDISLDAQLA